MALPSAQAVHIDVQGFGERLNGWQKGRYAEYSFADGNYRTHQPTITQTTGGGLFVSVKIDQGRGSKNILHLELTFAADSRLLIGQVKGSFAGKKVDTGQIQRLLPAAAGDEAAPELLNPTQQLAAELFAALDANILKNAEGSEDKTDLLGRMFGDKNKMNISGAVRHNFNLLMQEVR